MGGLRKWTFLVEMAPVGSWQWLTRLGLLLTHEWDWWAEFGKKSAGLTCSSSVNSLSLFLCGVITISRRFFTKLKQLLSSADRRTQHASLQETCRASQQAQRWPNEHTRGKFGFGPTIRVKWRQIESNRINVPQETITLFIYLFILYLEYQTIRLINSI